MKTTLIVEYSLLGGILLFYLIYTIKYALVLRKNTFLKGRRKLFHSLMIWVFPFVWILILKSFFKPIPGSTDFDDKRDSPEYKENFGAWFWSAGASHGRH